MSKNDPSIGGPIGTLAFSAAIWLLRMERFFPLCGRVDPQPKDHFSIEVSETEFGFTIEAHFEPMDPDRSECQSGYIQRW